ncbi:hypothetical protein C6497_16460 [Candidatus Poribacteria bacterium]|nr:MAG: hypothetical protein C6497_16460 [Candidatus Poribacteria bacterium]
MTAYADETLAILKVLGHDVCGSVDWNSRLQFEGLMETRKGLLCNLAWVKYGCVNVSNDNRHVSGRYLL